MPNPLKLSTYWQSRVDTWRGVNRSAASPGLHYTDLAMSGLDFQGQVSSVFEVVSTQATAGVAFDVGAILLPGVAKLEADVKVSGDVGTETMVVLQRLPTKVYDKAVSPKDFLGDKGSVPPGTALRTSRPIVLQAMAGSAYRASLTVTANTEITPPVDTDELGISLALGVTASASAELQFVKLRSQSPSFYPDPQAPEVQLNVAMQPELERLLGSGGPADKAAVKKEIGRYIKERLKALALAEGAASKDLPVVGDAPASGEGGGDTQVVDTALAKGLNYAFRRGLKGLGAKVTISGDLVGQVRDALNSTSSADLLAGLQKLRKAIDASTAYPNTSQGQIARQADRDRVQAYEMTLRRLIVLGQSVPGYRGGLGLFKLVSMTTSFDASAGATAAKTLMTTSDEPAGKPAIKGLDVSLEVKSTFTGRAQLVRFRFQTYIDGNGPGPLVQTQDTLMTYRSLEAFAGTTLSGQLGIQLADFKTINATRGVSIGAQAAYRSLTYRSCNARWVAGSNIVPGAALSPLSGSGVVFGASFDVKSVAASLAKGAAGKGRVAGLAQQLHVPVELLVDVLGRASLQDAGLPELLFVETAFAFDATVQLHTTDASSEVVELADPFAEPTVQAFIDSLSAPPPPSELESESDPPFPAHNANLESIRIRVRMADAVESSQPLFSLGFQNIASFTVDLTKVARVGHEGFFDLITWWLHDETCNTDDKRYSAAQELCVPPVALLHQ